MDWVSTIAKDRRLFSVRWLFLIIMLAWFSGCTTTHNFPATLTDIHRTMDHGVYIDHHLAKAPRVQRPKHINDALMPSLGFKLPPALKDSEKRFDLSVHEVPAKTFFMGLVKGTNRNMLVSPKLEGKVTLTLKNITIRETLDATRDLYGYEYRITPFGYEISPRTLETRLYNVNYLNVNRSGQSETQISSGQITNAISGSQGGGVGTSNNSHGSRLGSSVKTRSESDFWRHLASTLDTMVGNKEGKFVVINSIAGVVMVRTYPDELRQIANYLDTLQTNVNREVILEAKIIEVELNKGFQTGIDWTLFGFKQGDIQNENDEIPTFSKIFSLAITKRNPFSLVLKLLSTQGDVQVLSSPRIATVNNQKAVIKVGTDEFFVTNVASTTIAAGTGIDTTQSVDLTPFFSGIALDVTPMIDADGAVILHIHPTVSLVEDQTKEVDLGKDNKQMLPLAKSTIRESDSIVRAENGQVIVIGGLMQNSTSGDGRGSPGLEKIPLLGNLFHNTTKTTHKSELVILLRPIVIGKHSWEHQIAKSATRFNQLDKDIDHYNSARKFKHIDDQYI